MRIIDNSILGLIQHLQLSITNFTKIFPLSENSKLFPYRNRKTLMNLLLRNQKKRLNNKTKKKPFQIEKLEREEIHLTVAHRSGVRDCCSSEN